MTSLRNGVFTNLDPSAVRPPDPPSRTPEVAANRTLQEVRLAYLASCGPSAAMIRRTTASRVDGMISIIVIAEGP
jgi:hypothetical protein